MRTTSDEALEEEVYSSGVLTAVGDERRACPRVPLDQLVLWCEGGAFAGWGDVSTGGALWTGRLSRAPAGAVEVSLCIPSEWTPLRLRAEVLGTRPSGDAVAVHLRFIDIPLESEWQIARHVDDCMLLTGAPGRR